MKFTRVINGTTQVIDTENLSEEDLSPIENDGVCCLRCLIPITEETKQFEDPDNPGMIAAYSFDQENDLYHPLGKDGWPDESITINKDGNPA